VLDTGRDVIEAPALAHALADAYHLRVVGLSPLEGGSLNSAYRVEATDGDFHLKCYDGRIYQADQIRRSIEAQEYVGRSDVPVPAVLRNVDGDAFTEIPGLGSVVLSTFIQGSHRRRGSIPARAASRGFNRVLAVKLRSDLFRSLLFLAWTRRLDAPGRQERRRRSHFSHVPSG